MANSPWKSFWRAVFAPFKGQRDRWTGGIRGDLGTLRENLDVTALALARMEVRAANWQEDRLTSCLCTQARCSGAAFEDWCRRLGQKPRYYRKIWEFVFLARALDEAGLLTAGNRGLGFGVGKEPLTPYFASRGCELVATDLAPERAAAKGWQASDMHASGLEGLNHLGLCPEQEFQRLVSFRAVDMNEVPDDLRGFDFCWSSCALEHLGSLEHGTRFVERSLDCLRPGGVAVHTTEFNVASEDETVAEGHTVLYRRRDLEALIGRLETAGHQVAAMDWDPGEGVLDNYVDFPPHHFDLMLRVRLGSFVTTSVGLIVVKGGA